MPVSALTAEEVLDMLKDSALPEKLMAPDVCAQCGALLATRLVGRQFQKSCPLCPTTSPSLE